MKLDLKQPDQRRALRSIVQAIVALAMIGLAWWFAPDLSQDGLKYILGWAMLIILIGTCGYIMENGLRSFKWTAPGGFGGEATSEPTPVEVVNPPSNPVPVKPQEPKS